MEGRCLCGAIRVSAPAIRKVEACHCGMCRRWGGGPLLAMHCGAADLRLSGVDKLKTYRSSDWAERAFCADCGTHIFYKLLATGDYALPAGLFEEGPFELAGQIFVDRKPAYYDFANDTAKLTEAEVFAKYGAS